MKYVFKREYGGVISAYNQLICMVGGTPASVDFPIEMILDIHKRTPGYISKLAHTHPAGMDKLSQRDIKTLKTIAFAMYPYPISMSVITTRGMSLRTMSEVSDNYFTEIIYTALVEPRELWIARGKGVRGFDILEVEETTMDPITDLLANYSYEDIGVN